MKHDYKAASGEIEFCLGVIENPKFGDTENCIWSTGTSSKPRITAETLKSALNTLAMMQKLEEPSGDVIRAGIADFSLQKSPTTAIREGLKAMLEQVEKELQKAGELK